jgi:hypothetical protein
MLRQPVPFRAPRRAQPGRDGNLKESGKRNAPIATGVAPDVITYRAIYFNVEAQAYQPVPSTLYQFTGCIKEWWQITCDPEDWEQIIDRVYGRERLLPISWLFHFTLH